MNGALAIAAVHSTLNKAHRRRQYQLSYNMAPCRLAPYPCVVFAHTLKTHREHDDMHEAVLLRLQMNNG